MRQLRINKQITNRDSTSLDKYLQEIGKMEPISIEEEVELAKKIKKGDQFAKEKLIKANLRFVVSVAKQYQNNGLLLSDLIDEGNLGLIKAAERFDETRGFKFISYAVWWIRQAILQALIEESRVIRLPMNKVGQINRVSRAFSRFETENEREPTDEELAKALEMSNEDVREGLNLRDSHKCSSLDMPVGEDKKDSLLDIIVNPSSQNTDENLLRESLTKEFDRILKTFPTREEKVVREYFGLGCREKTLEEIGDELGYTRERIRQIKEKAVRRLRLNARKKLLREYLGQ